MKKPVGIAFVLLLLAGIIGIEHFFRRSDNTPTEAQETVANDPGSLEKTRKPIAGSERGLIDPQVPQVSVPAMEAVLNPDSNSDKSLGERNRSDSVGLLEGSDFSVFRFVRGRSVLGAGDPDEESIARLRKAVGQVASGMEGSVVIIDLDGLVTSESPFLVYANPRFDFTETVLDAYRRLDAEAEVESGD